MYQKSDLVINKANDFAPVLLIGYNRPHHFKKSLIALCKNEYSEKTTLYISIDGPKNKADIESQEEILDSINLAKGAFAKIKILRNNSNKGLAKNIVESIRKVLVYHNKIIVLEDDLVTSKAFLKFMNNALNYYEENKKIWHINGNCELNISSMRENIFISRFMDCWGWASWKDRWNNFENDPNFFIKHFNRKMIFKFNLDGNINTWDSIFDNKYKKMNTWAVFWYATIFLNNGLCISPWQSYVENIGKDGSGTNEKKIYKKVDFKGFNEYGDFIKKDNLIEDKQAIDMIKKLSGKSLINKILEKIIIFFLGYYWLYKLRRFINSIKLNTHNKS